MTRWRRSVRKSPVFWTPKQELALATVRAAGYVPVEDAIFQLHESMWRNAPVANDVKSIRNRAREQGFPGRVEWGLRLAKTKDRLYRAVIEQELELFVWPASLDETGLHIVTDASSPTVVPPTLVVRLRAIHGGLPNRTLGLRAAMLTRRPPIAMASPPPPNGLPVFNTSAFIRWLERERSLARWASQAGRVKSKDRRRYKVESVKPIVTGIVQEQRWLRTEPATRLADLVRLELAALELGTVGDDAVRACLDDLYIETGDSRYRSAWFVRRNSGLMR